MSRITYYTSILLIICAILNISGHFAIAQEVLAMSPAGANGSSDNSRSLYRDASGNYYHYGQCSGGTIILHGTSIPNPFGNSNGFSFLVKLDANMNVIWAKGYKYTNTSPNYNDKFYVDGDGNIFLTETYWYTVDFGSGLSASTLGLGYFTVKLNSNGDAIWLNSSGGRKIVSEGNNLRIFGFNSDDGLIFGGDPITNAEGTTCLIDTAGTYINHLQIDEPGGYESQIIWGTDALNSFYGTRSNSIGSAGEVMEFLRYDELGNLTASAPCSGLGGKVFELIYDSIYNHYYYGGQCFALPATSMNLKQLRFVKVDGNFQEVNYVNLGSIYTGNFSTNSIYLNYKPYENNLYFFGEVFNANMTHFGTYEPHYGIQNNLFSGKLDQNLNIKWYDVWPSNATFNSNAAIHVDADGIYMAGKSDPFTYGSINFVPTSGTNDCFVYGVKDLDTIDVLLQGTVFVDQSQDGIYDANEYGYQYNPISSNMTGAISYTNINGNYSITGGMGQNIVYSDLEIPQYWDWSTPDSVIINNASQDTIITDINFGIFPIPNIQDLTIDIQYFSDPTIAQDMSGQITYMNIGTDTISGSVWLIQDSALVFQSSTTLPDLIAGDSVRWDFMDLGPGQMETVYFTDSVANLVTLIGVNTSGFVVATPVASDTVPGDNYDYYDMIVTGSYDPNDLQVHPNCGITEGFIQNGNYLEYTIRFQNTGNYPATEILLVDTLSALMDISSIGIVASSHEISNITIEDSVMRIYFGNIGLPPEYMDPLGSQGFCKFKVRPISSMVAGDSLKNTVEIYFDMNPEIVTNTTTTGVEQPISIQDIALVSPFCSTLGSIQVVPHCVQGGIQFSLDNINYTYSNTLSGIAAGTHTLWMVENNDTTSISFNVNSGALASTSTDVQTACDSFTWIDGNIYTSSTNTPNWTLTNAAGCDSVVTLDLTINTVNIGTTFLDTLNIQAMATNAQYQWVDCNDNFSWINGETGQNFSATLNGSYAVIITEEGCTDTSACVIVMGAGIDEMELNGLVLYPNPTNGELAIGLGNIYEDVTINQIDLLGQLVKEQSYKSVETIHTFVEGEPGFYQYEIIIDHERKATFSVLKE